MLIREVGIVSFLRLQVFRYSPRLDSYLIATIDLDKLPASICIIECLDINQAIKLSFNWLAVRTVEETGFSPDLTYSVTNKTNYLELIADK